LPAQDDARRIAEAWVGACPPGGAPRLVETHISWLALCGDTAWKLKKPVRLDFLDFSTLEARKAACEEEVRLNRRLAPGLYHGVVPVTGTPFAPRAGGAGAPIEYAVRMARFPDGAVAGEGALPRLRPEHMDRLAHRLARLHLELPGAQPADPWGEPAAVWAAAAASLDTLARAVAGDAELAGLAADARRAARARFDVAATLLEHRRRAGAVRECHGDLHLGNLVLLDDELVPFDALEFDPALRWTDTLNEVAFLVMDLQVHGRDDLAWRFLNAYLDATGDHDGLPLLPFFLAYRAIVRAMVKALGPQAATPASRAAIAGLLRYAASPPAGAPCLVLMTGISGSGKSWLAFQLAGQLPAIHLRSDVERRRLFGRGALERTGLAPGAGMYGPRESAAVYARLAEIAEGALHGGLPVIVDATNLREAHRAPFASLARRAGVPLLVVTCHADAAVIAERVQRRAREGRDPSEAGLAVVGRQLAELERVTPGEADAVHVVDTAGPVDAEALATALRAEAQRPQACRPH